MELYINWMYLMIMYVVPFFLLLVLNSCIGVEISRARIRRYKMGHGRRNESGSGNRPTNGTDETISVESNRAFVTKTSSCNKERKLK